MGVSYVKFCPRCQTTTSVDSALCPNCGHHFRTHFQPKVSEKTVAMTSIPEAHRLQSGPSPLREMPEERRPLLRPRIVLIGVVFFAGLGLLYGVQIRHYQQSATTPRAAFQPYDIVIKGQPQDDSIPVATQSVDDLHRWIETQSPQKSSEDASMGDAPEHVELYRTKRIILVSPGTPGRVLLEGKHWYRIQLLEGFHKGTAGYIDQDAIGRQDGLSEKTADAAS